MAMTAETDQSDQFSPPTPSSLTATVLELMREIKADVASIKNDIAGIRSELRNMRECMVITGETTRGRRIPSGWCDVSTRAFDRRSGTESIPPASSACASLKPTLQQGINGVVDSMSGLADSELDALMRLHDMEPTGSRMDKIARLNAWLED